MPLTTADDGAMEADNPRVTATPRNQLTPAVNPPLLNPGSDK